MKLRNMNNNEVFDFVIEVLTKGEKTTNKNIPNDIFKIISYNIKKVEKKVKLAKYKLGFFYTVKNFTKNN